MVLKATGTSSCERQSFQAHHINTLAVTAIDFFYVTGLLKFSVICV